MKNSRQRIIAAFTLLTGLLQACGPITPERSTPEQTPTDFPVASPTHTPTDKPAATRTQTPLVPTFTPVPAASLTASPTHSLALEIKRELYFFPGAGGLSCPEDPILDLNTEFPAISALHSNYFIPAPDSQVICLYGIPLNEIFTIQVKLPLGATLLSADFVVEPGEYRLEVKRLDPERGPVVVGDGFDFTDPNILGIDVAWPPPMPPVGSIQLTINQITREAAFQSSVPGNRPRLSVLSTETPLGVDYIIQDGCLAFSPGERVTILGSGFPADQDIPIGIYTAQPNQGEPGRLVASGNVPSDEQGRFDAFTEIEPSDTPGLYYVVAVQDPSADHGYDAGPLACFQIR